MHVLCNVLLHQLAGRNYVNLLRKKGSLDVACFQGWQFLEEMTGAEVKGSCEMFQQNRNQACSYP